MRKNRFRLSTINEQMATSGDCLFSIAGTLFRLDYNQHYILFSTE